MQVLHLARKTEKTKWRPANSEIAGRLGGGIRLKLANLAVIGRVRQVGRILGCIYLRKTLIQVVFGRI